MLETADLQLKAMILLAVKFGFGNTGCALLPKSAVDFKGEWLTAPVLGTAE